MGYTTIFKGTLYFTGETSDEMLGYLKTLLGEDARDHPEWRGFHSDRLCYIDLTISDDLGGIEWNGHEKAYYMPEAIQFVIKMMRQKYSDFGLYGCFEVKSEEDDDHWYIVVDQDSVARYEELDSLTKLKYRERPKKKSIGYESYEIF